MASGPRTVSEIMDDDEAPECVAAERAQEEEKAERDAEFWEQERIRDEAALHDEYESLSDEYQNDDE